MKILPEKMLVRLSDSEMSEAPAAEHVLSRSALAASRYMHLKAYSLAW